MPTVVSRLDVPSSYRDRSYSGEQDQDTALAHTSTLYVGNLSFYTTEEQIYELFAKCGEIKRIIMGLDRGQKTPCGFCFVEYYQRKHALACMRFVNGSKLDDRIIRTDLDPGFTDGRQYGRGKSGGQVRDEYRQEYDAGRGGWGHIMRKQMEEADQENAGMVPSGAGEYHGGGRNEGRRKRGRSDDEEEDEDDAANKRARDQNPRFREDRSSEDEEDDEA